MKWVQGHKGGIRYVVGPTTTHDIILSASICFQVDDWFSVKRLVFHLFDVFPSNDLTCFPTNDWFSAILTFLRQMN